MTGFLSELLRASVLGSLLFLVLILLRPLTRRFFSLTWRYYTGLIPVLFLFGAAVVFTPLADLLARPENMPPAVHNVVLAEGAEPVEVTRNAMPQLFGGIANMTNAVTETAENVLAQTSATPETLAFYAALFWLSGLVVFLYVKISAYCRFRRGILRQSREIRVETSPVKVVVCGSINTPMLAGIFRPVIILPSRRYTEDELGLIIAHERVHLRRGDLLIKLILLIANAVHWFNPVVYLMNSDTSNMCELACDEAVVRHMSKDGRRQYGEVILSALEYGACRKTQFTAGMCADGKNIKRRLLNIMKFRKTTFSKWVLSVALSLAVALGGVLLAHASAGSEAAEQRQFYVAIGYLEGHSADIELAVLSPEEAAEIGAAALERFFGADLDGMTVTMVFLQATNFWDSSECMLYSVDEFGILVDASPLVVIPERWAGTVYPLGFDGHWLPQYGFTLNDETGLVTWAEYNHGAAPIALSGKTFDDLLARGQTPEHRARAEELWQFTFYGHSAEHNTAYAVHAMNVAEELGIFDGEVSKAVISTSGVGFGRDMVSELSVLVLVESADEEQVVLHFLGDEKELEGVSLNSPVIRITGDGGRVVNRQERVISGLEWVYR